MIPNDGGRVVEEAGGKPLPGEYVVGWIKRGPSGVIGTNKKDAQETVDAMVADFASENGSHPPPPDPAPESAEELLRSRQPDLVTTRLGGDRPARARPRRAGGAPTRKAHPHREMLHVAAAEKP